MRDWGIKVSIPGKDITSVDPRELSMSSKYSMLKYHMDDVDTATISPGDTEAHVDFTHGLGYTPAFIAYHDFDGAWRFIPGIPRAIDFTAYGYAYADATKVRCGINYNTGKFSTYEEFTAASADTFFVISGVGESSGTFGAGNVGGDSTDGALRFVNIAIPQGTTINSATLYAAVEEGGASGTSVNLNIFGIDEDNTSNFSSSPMGRSQTSASTNYVSAPAQGTHGTITVTSQVQEIINRTGWSSGNAMGFLAFDNGGSNGNSISDTFGTGIESYLSITYGNSQVITFRTVIFKDKIA